MIKMAYRPSFEFVGKPTDVHVVVKGGIRTACGLELKGYKKVYNLLLQYPQTISSVFCKKCRVAYHERDERYFPVVK